MVEKSIDIFIEISIDIGVKFDSIAITQILLQKADEAWKNVAKLATKIEAF